MRSYLAAALFASLATAQEEYKRMADNMAMFEGYTWEAHEVTTEDGFILTTFHFTGNKDGPYTPDKPPVFF